MSVDNPISTPDLLEECDHIIAVAERKIARNAAYHRIVDDLATRGIDRELIMIAGDVVDALDRIGLKDEAMSLEVFLLLNGEQALERIISDQVSY